jgi:hypothetical protein
MVSKGGQAFTKWMMLFSPLPRDHPDYEVQEGYREMVIGAALGAGFVGLIVGAIIAKVF